jgi:TetR/AcrR family transcriptional regulator, cholesterol catabolism regulator
MPAGRKPARKHPRAPSRSIAESRKRDIVEHAIRLMEEKGFAAVSVQHLADALEFSKANFYHHIESKEELLYEIFLDTLRYSSSRIEAILNGSDSLPDKLRALIEFYVSLMTDRRAVMLVWFKERAHLNEAHQSAVTQEERRVTTLLEQLYATGIAEGYFKAMDTTILRLAIFGLCFHLTKLPQPPDSASIVAITRQLQELVTTGLLTPPAAAEEARRLSMLHAPAPAAAK